VPLTAKGKKVMAAMRSQYGAKKGKQVFYASANKGTIKGGERYRKRKLSQMGKHPAVERHMMS